MLLKRLQSAFLYSTLLAAPLIAADKPNILFIFCDDLGYGDVGVFNQNQRAKEGKPAFSTPHIDALAKEGMQLRAHYCGAPVCAPSRATLFLGMSQGNCPVRNNQFDKAFPKQPTLGDALRSNGYSTALIGKWGFQGKGKNPATWPSFPTKRGFDYYLGCVRHRDGHEHYPADNIHFKKKKNKKSNKNKGKHQRKNHVEIWLQDQDIGASLKGCYTTDLWTAAAKKWMIDHQKKSPQKPFFLFLSFDTPHAATQLPSCQFPSGYGIHGGLRWIGKKGQMINTANNKPDSYIHPDYRKKPWKNVYKRYASSVRRIDNCVADLIQTVKDLGIDKDTIIVFSSDHGPSIESYLKERYKANFFKSSGPFSGVKRDCLEGGIRPGAIVRWPGKIPAGTISETPSQMQDWMATFCDLSNSPTPAISDGVSLLPTLTQQGTQILKPIYTEYAVGSSTPNYPEFPPNNRGRKRGEMQTIRIGKLKALRYNIKSATQAFEVFDVIKDPGESTNIAGKPGIPDQQFWLDAVSRQHGREASAKRPYDTLPVAPIKRGKPTQGFLLRSQKSSANYAINLPRSLTPKTVATLTTDTTTGTCQFDGYFHAPEDGIYTFSMPPGVNGILYIHNILTLDTDSPQATVTSGKIKLKAGDHPLRLSIRNHGKAIKNVLRAQTPNKPQPTPVN